jgi:hypothetical protein
MSGQQQSCGKTADIRHTITGIALMQPYDTVGGAPPRFAK